MTAAEQANTTTPTATERMAALKGKAKTARAQGAGLSDDAATTLARLFTVSPGHLDPDCEGHDSETGCDCPDIEGIPDGKRGTSKKWNDGTCGQLDALLIRVDADRIQNALKYAAYTPEPGFRLQVLREVIILMASGHIGRARFWALLVAALRLREGDATVIDQALRELDGIVGAVPATVRFPHGPKHPRKAFAREGAPGTLCDGTRCGGRTDATTEKMLAVFEHDYRAHPALDAVYAVPVGGRHIGRAVFEVDGGAKAEFGARIASSGYEKLGTQPKSEHITSIATLIRGDAWRSGGDAAREILSVRSTPHQGGYLIDLGADGRYVHVTTEGWRLVDHSDDLPVMLATQRALPIPVHPENGDPRLGHLGFNADDPNWHQIRMWQATAFFADHERQLMLLTGGSGSGKTKRAESIAWIVDPLDTDSNGDPVMGGPLPEDEDLAPMLSRNYLFTSDNLTTLKPEDSDRLCRIATGYHFTRRVLYTTSDSYTVVVKRPGLLTGIDVPPQLQEDAQNRMLHLELDANAPKRPSVELAQERVKIGPQMLGALLDDMVQVLRAFKAGDYDRGDRFPIVACAARAFGEAYVATRIGRQRDLARNRAEGDNLLQAVAKMVKHAGVEEDGRLTLILAGPEWVEALNATLPAGSKPPGGWVTSGTGFGSRLGRNKDTVKALGLEVVRHEPRREDGRAKRYTQVTYVPGTESLDIPDPAIEPEGGQWGVADRDKVTGPFLGAASADVYYRVRQATRTRTEQA